MSAASVFSKMTPNGKITLYMPQREFIDHLTHIEPIDGAVLIDQEYLEGDCSVAVQLVTCLRYGREDDEVMGLNMSREMCLASIVINKQTSLDRLTQAQENLVAKYGKNCFPFHLDWSASIGASMYILQPPHLTGKPCGVRHHVEVFCLRSGVAEPQIHKRSSINFDVKVIQMPGSADKSAVWIPPAASVSRPLLFALGRVNLEMCLEKSCVMDGEPLVVNVTIDNHTNKSITRMKTSLVQNYKLSFSEGERKLTVCSVVSPNGFPIAPGGTLNLTALLYPNVPTDSKKSDGLAVRKVGSKICLASSTLFAAESQKLKDVFGFIISYRVRVKLTVSQSPMNGTVDAEVPIFVVAKKPLTVDMQAVNQNTYVDKSRSLHNSTVRNRMKHRNVLQDVPIHFSKRDD